MRNYYAGFRLSESRHATISMQALLGDECLYSRHQPAVKARSEIPPPLDEASGDASSIQASYMARHDENAADAKLHSRDRSRRFISPHECRRFRRQFKAARSPNAVPNSGLSKCHGMPPPFIDAAAAFISRRLAIIMLNSLTGGLVFVGHLP